MQYLKDISKGANDQIFKSAITILATINIKKIRIESSSFESALNAANDPIGSEQSQFRLPLNLSEFYKIRCIPIEYHSLRLDVYKRMYYYPSSKYDPYDLWVIFRKKDMRVSAERTYLDYAESISLKGETYNIKGKFEDLDNFMHVFLVKSK